MLDIYQKFVHHIIFLHFCAIIYLVICIHLNNFRKNRTHLFYRLNILLAVQSGTHLIHGAPGLGYLGICILVSLELTIIIQVLQVSTEWSINKLIKGKCCILVVRGELNILTTVIPPQSFIKPAESTFIINIRWKNMLWMF